MNPSRIKWAIPLYAIVRGIAELGNTTYLACGMIPSYMEDYIYRLCIFNVIKVAVSKILNKIKCLKLSLGKVEEIFK